jgi:glycerophosphoryl diester phosphodiesterase
MMAKKVRFQAHRGVCSEYPENTMAAYRAAVDQGYDIIEMDIKFTSDDVCVMLHDRTLNRTSRLNGQPLGQEPLPIDTITYAQCQEYDVGLWKGEQFAGERIPTLAETLAFGSTQEIDCKIDNVWETFPEAQQDIFLDVAAQANLGGKLGVTCRKLDTLQKAAKRLPMAELHWDGDNDLETLERVSAIAQGHKLTIWVCYENSISSWFKGKRASKELCDQVRRYGQVGLWLLVEHQEGVRAIQEFAADAIETNGQLKPIR